MNQKQIANTYALQGGTQAWKNAGYPMEGAGGQPIDLQPMPNAPNIPAAPEKSNH
jgi:hypothetical protein